VIDFLAKIANTAKQHARLCRNETLVAKSASYAFGPLIDFAKLAALVSPTHEQSALVEEWDGCKVISRIPGMPRMVMR